MRFSAAASNAESGAASDSSLRSKRKASKLFSKYCAGDSWHKKHPHQSKKRTDNDRSDTTVDYLMKLQYHNQAGFVLTWRMALLSSS